MVKVIVTATTVTTVSGPQPLRALDEDVEALRGVDCNAPEIP